MRYMANEKSFNRIMFNVNPSTKKELNYPIYNVDGNDYRLILYNGFFNKNHWEMLDIISTCLIQLIYKIPKPTNSKKSGKNISINNHNELNRFNLYSMLPNQKQEIVKYMASNLSESKLIKIRKRQNNNLFNCKTYSTPIELYFNDKDLKSIFPILKKYNYNQIFKIINELSIIKIDVPKYIVKYFDKDERRYKRFEFMTSFPESIFTLKSIKKNKGINGKIYSRNYHLSFNSTIGQLLLQNLKCCNVNFLNDDFYSLDNFSHFLYKKIILKKNDIISMTFNKIALILNYDRSHSEFKSQLINSLNNIKNNNLISEFSYNDKKVKITKY